MGGGLVASWVVTPISRADLEPANTLPGPMFYHVWERTETPLKVLWAQPLFKREYRGMVSAEKLAPILFPEGK